MRCNVSGDKSAANVCASISTAVRQQPFTAMLPADFQIVEHFFRAHRDPRAGLLPPEGRNGSRFFDDPRKHG